jgi:hypothetical protein
MRTVLKAAVEIFVYGTINLEACKLDGIAYPSI